MYKDLIYPYTHPYFTYDSDEKIKEWKSKETYRSTNGKGVVSFNFIGTGISIYAYKDLSKDYDYSKDITISIDGRVVKTVDLNEHQPNNIMLKISDLDYEEHEVVIKNLDDLGEQTKFIFSGVELFGKNSKLIKTRTVRNYVLIKYKEKIYSDVGEGLQIIEDLDATDYENFTKDMYMTYGIPDPSYLNYDDWIIFDEEFELLLWSNNTETPEIEITTPDKPIYKLLKDPKLVVWIDAEDKEDNKHPYLIQKVKALTTLRFLVSKDNGRSFQTYAYNRWMDIENDDIDAILRNGIRGDVLSRIPTSAWATYFDNKAFDHNFILRPILYSESNNIPTLKTINIKFPENKAPVIYHEYVNLDEIHNEYVNIRLKVRDYEDDGIKFRVLVKHPTEDEEDEGEFIQIAPLEGWYSNSKSDIIIDQSFNYPYFKVGTNTIKIEIEDSMGAKTEWEKQITLSNEDPEITIEHDEFGMSATIFDKDGDDVSHRLLVNDKVVYDCTDFESTPLKITRQFSSELLEFGKENTVRLEFTDTHGGTNSAEIKVMGTYRGLLFKDEEGNYLVDDQRNILKNLEFDRTIIGGNTSDSKKVILENRTGFPIKNTKIFPSKRLLNRGIVVEISDNYAPFKPMESIDIAEVIQNKEFKEFYIRIKTDRSAFKSGVGHIEVEADNITE